MQQVRSLYKGKDQASGEKGSDGARKTLDNKQGKEKCKANPVLNEAWQGLQNDNPLHSLPKRSKRANLLQAILAEQTNARRRQHASTSQGEVGHARPKIVSVNEKCATR